MKNVALSCLLLLSSAVPMACGGSVSFDVPLDAETTVQGAGLLGGLLSTLPAFDGLTTFDVSTSSEFENNNAEKERVTEAILTSFDLTATAPAGATLDFLDEITFFVEAPGLDRVRVATKTIPDGATTVALDLDDRDLSGYVKADSMTFTTEVTGTQPEDDTTIRADLVLNITAEIVGGL